MANETLSGRELDALIAERLMGWQRMPDATALAPFAYKRPDGHVVHPYSAPEYSKSISGAMKVVEKMWQAGWQVEMVNGYKLNTLITDNLCVWWVRFIDNENDMNNWSAEADSLPEAICRAALKAIEEGKPATTSTVSGAEI